MCVLIGGEVGRSGEVRVLMWEGRSRGGVGTRMCWSMGVDFLYYHPLFALKLKGMCVWCVVGYMARV